LDAWVKVAVLAQPSVILVDTRPPQTLIVEDCLKAVPNGLGNSGRIINSSK